MISDIISLVFILPGAFMVFSAAVGTARFNSTLARVHAITKPQTTGLVLMITGTVIRVTTSDGFGVHEKGDIAMMVLLVLFALMLTRAPIGRSVAHDTPRVQRAAAFVLATATATLIGAALITGFGTESVNLRPNTTEQLATQIFATWSWPFELLSLLLLIAFGLEKLL